jgi:NADPH:quinone reductase
MMRAVVCESFAGPDALRIGEIENPQPAAGQVLVDVHAASVSFMECLMVAGKYQMRPQTPFVPGTDAAGVVSAVDAGGSVLTRSR